MAKNKPGSGDNYPSLFDQIKDQREELLKEVARVERELTKLYGATYKEVLQLSAVRKAIENGADFEWDANAAASKKLDAALTSLANATTALLQSSVVASWAKGEKNVETNLYAALGGGKAGKEAIQKTAELARASLRERSATAENYFNGKLNGFSVSDSVWNLKGEAKKELEIIIQNGIKEGKTPEALAKEAQRYLKEPNRLFRRVRDKDTGELELSAAAKKYHPGQGVYRSSYKNALRLARTEITAAYRRAEWESYQSNPLIIGYEIRLSNNHTTTTSTGKTVKLVDICDKMAGRYPKPFEWTGWHPQCRCVMIPITVSGADFKERIKALKKGQLQEWKPKDTITEMPAEYTKWMKENEARLLKARSLPYWIRDNYKNGDIKKGLVRQIAELKEVVKQAQEQAAIITEFDAEISSFERWRDTLGLDLSEIYKLRNSGQRDQLEAAVEALNKEAFRRLDIWGDAGNKLYEVIKAAEKAGFSEIAARAKAEYNANNSGNEAGKKWLPCTARLKKATTKYNTELQDAIAKQKAGLQEVTQPKELDNLLTEKERLNPDFWKLLDPKKSIKFDINLPKPKKDPGAHFDTITKTVYIPVSQRYIKSPYGRVRVVYHEVGHAIDDQRRLWRSPEVTAMREAQKARLRQRGNYPIYEEERVYNTKTGAYEYRYKLINSTKVSYGAYVNNRIQLFYDRVRRTPESYFTGKGYNKSDVLEAICSTMDTLMSLNVNYGWGHSKSYMRTYGASEMEYMAHAFENAFHENIVFKHFMPEIYDEMVAYIRSLQKGIDL